MKIFIRFMRENTDIMVKPGTTLLQAARLAKVPIRTRCGGQASCLMCKVKVEDEKSCSRPSVKEVRKLGSLLHQRYRLSCQAKAIQSPVKVEVPEDPLKKAIRKQLSSQQKDD